MKRIETLAVRGMDGRGIDPGLLRRACPGLRHPRNKRGAMTTDTELTRQACNDGYPENGERFNDRD